MDITRHYFLVHYCLLFIIATNLMTSMTFLKKALDGHLEKWILSTLFFGPSIDKNVKRWVYTLRQDNNRIISQYF